MNYKFTPEHSAYTIILQWSLIHIGIMWIFTIGMTLSFTQSINRQPNDDQSEDSDEATNSDRTEDLEQIGISTNTFGNHIDGQHGYQIDTHVPIFTQAETQVPENLERFHITEEKIWLQCMLDIIQHQ
jgi:hypothetical protein